MSVSVAITESGYDLLRAAPGHKLVYTRGVCGSGYVDEEKLENLTQICEYVMDLSIVDFGPSKTAAKLRLQLDNRNAPNEFQLRQIGVCAKLMDGETELIGETLLQVVQYDKPDIVRAIPHVSEFIINVLMGRAESTDAVIDMAAYVSIRQFRTALDELKNESLQKALDAHNTDLTAHSNQRYVIATRIRDPGKPAYGLGGGGDQMEVSVALDTSAYTGEAEVAVVVSGSEYDAENMSAAGGTAPDGTIIITTVEE